MIGLSFFFVKPYDTKTDLSNLSVKSTMSPYV